MRRKRLKHCADTLCHMFCGWRLVNSYADIESLGSGALKICRITVGGGLARTGWKSVQAKAEKCSGSGFQAKAERRRRIHTAPGFGWKMNNHVASSWCLVVNGFALCTVEKTCQPTCAAGCHIRRKTRYFYNSVILRKLAPVA